MASGISFGTLNTFRFDRLLFTVTTFCWLLAFRCTSSSSVGLSAALRDLPLTGREPTTCEDRPLTGLEPPLLTGVSSHLVTSRAGRRRQLPLLSWCLSRPLRADHWSSDWSDGPLPSDGE